MSWFAHLDSGKFVLFTLILSRVGGLITTAPIYKTPAAPMQFRALLTVVIALLIMPGQWDTALSQPGSLLQYLVFAGSEMVIGACLGLGVDIIFSGVHVAGQIVGQLSGELMAEIYDPNSGQNTPVLSNFLSLVTLAAFVSLGGHRIVMRGLLDTFQAIPAGTTAAVSRSLVDTFVVLVSQSFALGIRAAAPLTVALLMSTVVIGLVGRTLPQLNVMSWGFGLTSLVMYGTLFASLAGAVSVFQDQVEPALESLTQALAMPGLKP